MRMNENQMKEALEQILVVTKKIDNNATLLTKNNGKMYIELLDTQVEKRAQIWISATQIVIFAGSKTQIFDKLTSNYSISKSDSHVTQRKTIFESDKRIELVIEFLNQFIATEQKTTKKAKSTKAVSTKKVSKKVSASA